MGTRTKPHRRGSSNDGTGDGRMNTGCPDCDRVQAQTGSAIRLCPKHTLEYLKYAAEIAQNDYLEELKAQSKKETKTRK